MLGLLGMLGLSLDWTVVAEGAPSPPLLQTAKSDIAAPDLGNLYLLAAWLKDQNAPRLSFLDPKWKSLNAWKKVARPPFLDRLSYAPRALPLSAEVVSREQREGFTIETVRIQATPAYDIPAKVLVPNDGKGRLPGVLALHCHSGQYVWGHEKVLSSPQDSPALIEFRDRTYGRPYAELLARRGFVVLVIDALYFGARRLRVEDLDATSAPGDVKESLQALGALKSGTREWIAAVNSLCSRYEQLTAKTIFAAGATWPGLLTWDDMRSLDYLCSRPEVDGRRIGCLGLSLGGLRTAHLIAADARVKAACVTGWMPEFGELLRNHIRHHTWMAYIPGLYSSLDLPDAAALIAPGALLVQQCSRDNLYPMSAMQGGVNKLKAIFTKAGIPERFRGSFHDEPHSFRPAMQDQAFAWLEKWL